MEKPVVKFKVIAVSLGGELVALGPLGIAEEALLAIFNFVVLATALVELIPSPLKKTVIILLLVTSVVEVAMFCRLSDLKYQRCIKKNSKNIFDLIFSFLYFR